MVGEMGMGMPAKFMPTIVNVFFCLGLFGKIPGVDVDLVKKISAVWIGANGLFGYFNTDGWMAGWGGTGLTAADKGMGRLMAQCMVASAVYTVGTAFLGKSALEVRARARVALVPLSNKKSVFAHTHALPPGSHACA